MVERSQKEVWRMTPWLVLILLLGNFIMMAFDAREITSGQRVIRVWTQAAADFVQSPVTTVSSGVSGYFSSIANLRSAQCENYQLKKENEELKLQIESSKGLS
jgi:cell shape-determining protein MreC